MVENLITIENRKRGSNGGHIPADGNSPALYWLPHAKTWREDVISIEHATNPNAAWSALVSLANKNLDFVKTARVDRALQDRFSDSPPPDLVTRPTRLAVLSSSTSAHLLPSIRVAALRRGFSIKIYEPQYGQYRQDLFDPNSGLHQFQPNAILFAFDANHLFQGIDLAWREKEAEEALHGMVNSILECWRVAQEEFGCSVFHQTTMPVFPSLLGNNEHRLPASRQRLVVRLNERLRELAAEHSVDLLALDMQVTTDGLAAWHDPVLWHRAKQEVSPVAAPLYGDLLVRLISAREGRSHKCLVFDLDNTLWGGVVGDDGLEGIVLGQGSALGEAFIALQAYARDLAKRGVILAVCSKNDEANAIAAFDEHPEMLLKRTDIAAFVANWDDKAKNLRRIAEQLNIGVDSLVFVDDNPFERNLIRSEIPTVAVPEVPDDPALIPRCLADAGYFEAVAVTDEDRQRSRQYQVNLERNELQAQAADLPTYLRSLQMQLVWKPFDRIGMSRIVQLINKTNQFNLTTRRYSDGEVAAVMDDARCLTLQLRLIDRFGDNGIIAIIIGRVDPNHHLIIDTWLMSCRVLGRGVEQATLDIIVSEAIRLGARRLIGEYCPSAKNAMVRNHYQQLGFTPMEHADGRSLWILDLLDFVPRETPMLILRAEHD